MIAHLLQQLAYAAFLRAQERRTQTAQRNREIRAQRLGPPPRLLLPPFRIEGRCKVRPR